LNDNKKAKDMSIEEFASLLKKNSGELPGEKKDWNKYQKNAHIQEFKVSNLFLIYLHITFFRL
jgi:hypothetical protein